jgi:hypothetical protein
VCHTYGEFASKPKNAEYRGFTAVTVNLLFFKVREKE